MNLGGYMVSSLPASVLVCHNLPIVREGLHRMLTATPGIDVVGAADNVTQAIVAARQTRPHVVLTGLALGSSSGIEVIERLGREDLDPPPRFLMYATIEDNELLTAVLRAGVSAVLADDASPEEMVLAVRIAARGQAMLGPGVAERMLTWFRGRNGESTVQPTMPMSELAVRSLTPREREILLLTASGMSIDDIAHQLYIGPTTVRTHIYRLRTKLQVKDRAQLVSLAYQAGLMTPA
ncbi:LuxR C-terminal-related transcriptional regulator [Allorhizocola rhizosphaerae]|uniref:LuxR C-terminal-related transcriptional regulator n=1 Tax=Allorhizocola rhizosphaerae TaxID=1872709 RepID=UPI001FE3544E|nr:response regulator transcription factor [Allorhizocola rhizosphaerae]